MLGENKVLLDQSIIDTIREHFIELHGDRRRQIIGLVNEIITTIFDIGRSGGPARQTYPQMMPVQ